MAHVTGSCHPHERPGSSSWLLASVPSPPHLGVWTLKQYMGTLSICFSSVCLDASQISGKNIFFLNKGTKEELTQKTRMQQMGVHAQPGGEWAGLRHLCSTSGCLALIPGSALFLTPASCQGRPWEVVMMARVVGCLPLMWRIWIEFTVPSFCLGPALALWGIWEVNQQMRALSVWLSVL